MVNVARISTFLSHNLTPVSFKPIHGSSVVSSFLNASQHTFAFPHAQTLGNSGSGSCSVDPYDAPSVGDQVFSPYDQTTAHVYRYRQQQSVNLGSW